MAKNDEEKTDDINDFIRATSMKSKIDMVHRQSFHSRKQSRIHDCLSSLNIAEPTAFSFDRSISLNAVSSCDSVEQTIREGDREAAVATIDLLSIFVIPLLPKQLQNQNASISNEKKWRL